MLKGLKKSNGLEAGYVYVPYVMVNTGTMIIDNGFYSNKNIRKSKLNKIFGFGKPIKINMLSVTSRYDNMPISNKYYQTVEIKKPS